jgi:bifunctional DNase/RNase
MQCVEPQCRNEIAMIILLADRRQVVDEKHLCDTHGRQFLTKVFQSMLPLDRENAYKGLVRFDVALVVQSQIHDLNGICLRSPTHMKTFFIKSGICEATRLINAFKSIKNGNAVLEASIGRLALTFGGDLKDVVISDYDNQTRAFSAQIRFLISSREEVVKIRPSDALCVALWENKPILVDEQKVSICSAPY